ncbi:MAG: ribosomal-processing cysteine protease Prp [Bacillota bacterium]|nr:ribosomal-processing cysteine protease Prp [Bacillota bacterium]
MIDIKVIKENNEIRTVVATGHATGGKKSEQICSGVSTLMYTLALSLQDLKRVGVNVVDDDVGMCIEIIRGYSKNDTQVVANTIVRGLKSISDLYPHSVRIRMN